MSNERWKLFECDVLLSEHASVDAAKQAASNSARGEYIDRYWKEHPDGSWTVTGPDGRWWRVERA